MSVTEMKQELSQLLDAADEAFIADVLGYAKERLEGEEVFEHETPAFFAELDQRVDATLNGEERLKLEEAEEVWAGKRPRP